MRDKPKSLDELRNHNPENDATPVDAYKDKRISKSTRMRIKYSEMLDDLARQQSRQQGKKIHEADILDEALTDLWNKYGL